MVMIRIFSLFFVCGLLLFHTSINAQQKETFVDDINIDVYTYQDSLCLTIITKEPQKQMSFLMQGLCILIRNCKTSCDSIKIICPNAKDVRDKIKHHPNEVKATLLGNKQEIRPDLTPLVSALNNVQSKMYLNEDSIISCYQKIIIDKEEGLLSYILKFQNDMQLTSNDTLMISLTSTPNVAHQISEYNGKRLSKESKLPPSGLGSEPTIIEARNRCVKTIKKIVIH